MHHLLLNLYLRHELPSETTTMATCAKCQESLVVEIDDYDDDDEEEDTAMTESSAAKPPQTVADDVHLSCGCHLHWECLLDSYEYSRCPSCDQTIVSQHQSGSGSADQSEQVIVDLNNEGGRQQAIDIMPILREEGYLRAYPEERKCRAFLEFCREGDHRAIADLLKSCNERPDEDDLEIDPTDAADARGSKTADEVLRYQDPIGDMASGLHAAVANGHREVAWLLLLLASQLPEMEFPALVYQEAGALGIMREDQEGLVDIRSLPDAHGRTAEDVAREVGVIWTGWTGNGRLAMP